MRLAEHGGWMGRAQLTEGLDWHESLLDDELADLVADGTVLFNLRGREYRLGGTPWARRALQRLVQRGLTRHAVVGHTREPRRTHVGLAMRQTRSDGREQLVMAELDMPAQQLQGMLAMKEIFDGWVNTPGQ